MQTRSSGNTQGIDVSRYQGNIDWAKVKASGMTFVFIKATEGQTYTDPNFQTNVTGALAAGMLVGTYHFFAQRLPMVPKQKRRIMPIHCKK